MTRDKKTTEIHSEFSVFFCVMLQIGVGDEVKIEELMDVASEPVEFNLYLVTNFSALTQDIANRLSDAFCNSTHFLL